MPAGRISPYRPALWVPLMIIGRHPRLTPGRRGGLASLTALAPTLADLLGMREPVPWQGHSLVDPPAAGRSFAFGLESMRVAEDDRWTAIEIDGDDRPQLFSRSGDWLQRRDFGGASPVAADLIARAERQRRLNDYLLRHDLVWPNPHH